MTEIIPERETAAAPVDKKPDVGPATGDGGLSAGDQRGSGGWWRGGAGESVRRNSALVVVLLALVVFAAYRRPDVYLDPDRAISNIMTILTQASAVGVLAIGMTFVIIGGGIDLSVGSLVGLASVWCTTVATQEFGMVGILFTAIVVGTLAGVVNGLLIAYGRMVAFIATLAMMVAARGLAAQISNKTTQVVSVSGINSLAETDILGIPLLVLVFAAVVAIAWVVLNRTTFGRRTVAVGGNLEAARLAGINVKRQTLLLYALSGLCCGIAAIILVSLSNAGASTHGEFYELDAIAAAIIGGTSLAGGRGTVVGTLLGVLVFAMITNLFILLNLQIEVQNIVKGAIIIGAVLVQQFRIGGLRKRRGVPASG
ncbi:ABC transporter permease [Plantactinospora soyae]|uniref:Ribose transport system permease protein n=1 Tax=Plantactinospora soyae TaxID=1544732 RepID=A0A927R4E8_9ACTN|nr:ribose transport system permease protein [Plantactinospora soyae]